MAQALSSGRLQMSPDAENSSVMKVTMAAVAMGATAVLLGRRQSLPSLGPPSTAPAVAQLELPAAASPSRTAPATALVGRMAAATLPGMSTAMWWAPRACRAVPGTTLAGATRAARAQAATGTTTAPLQQASLWSSASCHSLPAALGRAAAAENARRAAICLLVASFGLSTPGELTKPCSMQACEFAAMYCQECIQGLPEHRKCVPAGAGAGVGAGIAGLEHGRHHTTGTHGAQSGYEGRQTGSGTGGDALRVVHAHV